MLVFNQTASPYNGLIQRIETNIYGDDGLGKISGDSTLLGLWTTRLNIARNRADSLILQVDRQVQVDDRNHADLSIILMDLVANQRVYSFNKDENGNVILEIFAVYILSGGVYQPLDLVDENQYPAFYDGQDLTGVSTKYGRKGNVITLEYLPAANVTSGLKLDISRESSYFTTSDTTKEPGLGLYDVYLADWATFEYAGSNKLANVNITFERIKETEQQMQKFFSLRAQDKGNRLVPLVEDCR